jgi:putative ABC transport system permease protein
LLAVGAATAAAWWPARAMSRIPTVMALSGRPPRPAALDRSAVLAGLFLVAGIAGLATGSRVSDEASALDLALIAGGILALLVGVLLLGPIAIRGVARQAARIPIAPRLAVRDLGRYQARSGAALAAVSLALGIPVALVATTQAAENNAGPGNLSSSQLVVHPADTDGPFIPDEATIADMQDGVDALAAAMPDATVVRLDAAVSPNARPEPGMNGTPGISLAREIDEHRWNDLGLVYLATPALLDALHLAPDDLAGTDRDGSGVATSESGDVVVLDVSGPAGTARDAIGAPPVEHRLPSTYGSLPHALIGADQLADRGWNAVPSGRWLLETARPLTSAERSESRVIAAQHGFIVETRDEQRSLGRVQLGATGIGMLVALSILAMTVGLMRSESAGELRTLTAAGATRSTRRAITASVAGTLAALGAILGTAGAYVALAAGRLSDLAPLPVGDLGVIVVGTPLVAAAIGWLLAGREPAAVAHRPLE